MFKSAALYASGEKLWLWGELYLGAYRQGTRWSLFWRAPICKKNLTDTAAGKHQKNVFLGPFPCVFPPLVLKPTIYSEKTPEVSRHNAQVHEISGFFTSQARTERNPGLFSKKCKLQGPD